MYGVKKRMWSQRNRVNRDFYHLVREYFNNLFQAAYNTMKGEREVRFKAGFSREGIVIPKSSSFKFESNVCQTKKRISYFTLQIVILMTKVFKTFQSEVNNIYIFFGSLFLFSLGRNIGFTWESFIQQNLYQRI